MFRCLWSWWQKKHSTHVIEEKLPTDLVDTMNNDYAELVDTVFHAEEPVHYTEETHTRIQRLRKSISEELQQRSIAEPEEKRRSWRFESIDSEYRLKLFHGYIDDAVQVEPKLLRDTSIVRLLSLDIIG